jgi:hypothetical protein
MDKWGVNPDNGTSPRSGEETFAAPEPAIHVTPGCAFAA